MDVIRCNSPSMPRAFAFPIKCSAPPAIAPERPALLPDCNRTTTISPTLIIARIISDASSTLVPPCFFHAMNVSHSARVFKKNQVKNDNKQLIDNPLPISCLHLPTQIVKSSTSWILSSISQLIFNTE